MPRKRRSRTPAAARPRASPSGGKAVVTENNDRVLTLESKLVQAERAAKELRAELNHLRASSPPPPLLAEATGKGEEEPTGNSLLLREARRLRSQADLDAFNAFTSAWPIAIVVTKHGDNNNSIDLVSQIAVFVFCIVAALGHIFPKALTGSTHIVKAAFTLIALHDAPLPLRIAILLISLVPFIFPKDSTMAKVETVGGAVRQGWMAWFIFNALQTSKVSVPEVAAMAICKLIYRYERKKRCDEGRRSEYGILHSFEHLDLYLYVSAALVPDIALRQADWINIVYLLLSACCVALVPIRHGDGCRACLGTIMIIFADWYTYQSHWLSICATLIYAKSRASNPHVGFSWSRWQGLYVLSLSVSAKILYDNFGRAGLGAAGFVELLLLIFGVHQAHPDMWAAAWSCVVLGSLYHWPYKFALGLLWTLADVMDLRFMGRLNCGCHLSLLGLYACRELTILPVLIFWLLCALGFLVTNLYIGFTSVPPGWMPDDLIPWFDKKLRGNAFALNPLAYLLKPSSPILSWDYMTWERIGKMIDGIEWNGFQADLVIGVLSGGGFIEPLVSKSHPGSKRAVIRSQVWSRLTAKENIESVGHVFWNKNSWRSSKPKELRWTVEPPKGKTFRNILVVDDSVSSGKTMNNVLKFVRDQFPKADVRAAVLYAPEKSSGVCHVDYVVSRGRVPLIWPWGVEAD